MQVNNIGKRNNMSKTSKQLLTNEFNNSNNENNNNKWIDK